MSQAISTKVIIKEALGISKRVVNDFGCVVMCRIENVNFLILRVTFKCAKKQRKKL